MTPFRFAHEFRGDAAGFWRIFFDARYLTEQFQRVGVRDFDVRELRDDGDTITRVVYVVPARELPVVVRKLTGASLGYTERTVFYKQGGYADTVVEPTTLANRISISGRHTVEPSGPGRVIRVFEGSLDVAIKLVGKRLEATVLEDMDRNYAAGAEMTQAWLDGG